MPKIEVKDINRKTVRRSAEYKAKLSAGSAVLAAKMAEAKRAQNGVCAVGVS